MKQLIIVDSAAALNGGAAKPTDLSAFAAGAIGLYECGKDAWLALAPKGNFDIVGKRPNGTPVVIPEVNLSTLKAVKAAYSAGTAMSAELKVAIFMQPPIKNLKVYCTLSVIGNNVDDTDKINYYKELNASLTPTMIATDVAEYFTKVLKQKNINITAVAATDKVTFIAGNPTVIFAVSTYGDVNFVITTTAGTAPCGTPAQVTDLARKCAQEAGFEYTGDSELHPGYPVKVDSAAIYNIWTLTYSNVKHLSAHTTEEVVNQVVHIAVPVGATCETDLEKVLNPLL